MEKDFIFRVYIYIYIYICKCKLSRFGRDDAKQAKILFLIVVCQVEQVPKVKQKTKNNKLIEMLLQLKIIAIMNSLTFF